MKRTPHSLPDAPPSDAERLWAAMLTIWPVIIGDTLKHAPAGCAQLCREHAQALLAEWQGTQGPVPGVTTD
jgi:hypothetical protein